MNKIILMIPFALFVSNSVHASTDNPWYAGARAGASHITNMDDAVTSVTKLEDTNFAGGVFAGYQVTPWFALETGYTHLGNAKLDNKQGSYEAQGADFVTKFSYAISDSVDIFAKAGAFYYDWNAIGSGVANSDNGWSPTAGAGLEYFINKNVSTRVEYQYYNDVAGPDIHFAGLGLAFHWGAPAPVVVKEPIYVNQVTIATLEELRLTVPFAFDSSTITTGDAAKLAPFEQRLKEQDAAKIYVVGHTDSRGSEAYNQTLSVKRAEAVADALRQHLNLDSTRIIAQGRGESDPVASNQTEEGRAQNRRVDIISPSLDIETSTQVIAE
ncbi:membrane protein [Photobacterium angustum]|uniref:OmpA-like domain-containing protein n=1 Tax=Photobacterium angustum TaxID=661 RepID=A0ABX5H210_PHOAN|nr:OmpA family protein [Photobacterium angustum]KJG39035.1 membrane protein [Photobacterium angustum]PSX07383.1 hypothetical protein C0W27_15260 [Photobacterium angustum]